MCCNDKEAQSSPQKSGLKTTENKKKSNKQIFKIVMMGNIAVGKTSITQRYCHSKFDEKYYNTLGGAFSEKICTLKTGEQIVLNIWDTAGDERYRSIMPLYYRDAQAAILVYDISDKQTFDDLNYWIEELDNKVRTEGMILSIIGNKSDMPEENKRVGSESAKSFARDKGLLFNECSAKTNQNIDQLFENIITELLKKQ